MKGFMPSRDVTDEPAYQMAELALEKCCRYAAARGQAGLLIAAMQAVDAAWNEAPRKQIIGRKKPQGQEELSRLMQEPCKAWLPYAKELGAEKYALMEGREPTQFANFYLLKR